MHFKFQEGWNTSAKCPKKTFSTNENLPQNLVNRKRLTAFNERRKRLKHYATLPLKRTKRTGSKNEESISLIKMIMKNFSSRQKTEENKINIDEIKSLDLIDDETNATVLTNRNNDKDNQETIVEEIALDKGTVAPFGLNKIDPFSELGKQPGKSNRDEISILAEEISDFYNQDDYETVTEINGMTTLEITEEDQDTMTGENILTTTKAIKTESVPALNLVTQLPSQEIMFPENTNEIQELSDDSNLPDKDERKNEESKDTNKNIRDLSDIHSNDIQEIINDDYQNIENVLDESPTSDLQITSTKNEHPESVNQTIYFEDERRSDNTSKESDDETKSPIKSSSNIDRSTETGSRNKDNTDKSKTSAKTNDLINEIPKQLEATTAINAKDTTLSTPIPVIANIEAQEVVRNNANTEDEIDKDKDAEDKEKDKQQSNAEKANKNIDETSMATDSTIINEKKETVSIETQQKTEDNTVFQEQNDQEKNSQNNEESKRTNEHIEIFTTNENVNEIDETILETTEKQKPTKNSPDIVINIEKTASKPLPQKIILPDEKLTDNEQFQTDSVPISEGKSYFVDYLLRELFG